ncbi:MAG: hypothetical protein NC040_09405, partial [Muribaculaceae bacterium]|nr:hypothetical protein [Muribaculaceae bacterium]
DYSFFGTGTSNKKTRYSYEWYDWENDECCEYTSEEEFLFDMCNCYGVDENDIILLLDYGYTAMEIEEMFMDTYLLRSSIQEVKHNSFYDDFV